MFDLTSFFISSAFAQDEAASQGGAGSGLADIFSPQALLIASLFAVWFFLVIRPQQKKLADQEKMIKALQRGDRVVTSGGIHGKIAKVEEKFLILEIADGVQIKIDRDNVVALEEKPQDAVSAKEGEKK
jgi:preprotein translocase subunit YajC